MTNPPVSSTTTHVDEAIVGYVPDGDREAALRDLIVDFIAADPAMVGRADGYAHVTASAYVMNSESGAVLLHEHRRIGKWLPFGGHADPGEHDPAITALREGLEESGLATLEPSQKAGPRLIDLDVHVIPTTTKARAHIHLDFRYLFTTTISHVPQTAVGESDVLRWWHRTDDMTALDENVRRCLRKIWTTPLNS